MTRKQWLARAATLEAIIEYSKMECDNDLYNAAMMLRTLLMKDEDNE